jgi:hypothetical protein
MTTERQYDFYKLLYDEEIARGEQLRSQAKHYLSLATLYSAFVIFFVDKVLPLIEAENKHPSSVVAMKIVFLATICAMAASFLFSLLVVQVSTFEALTDPNDLIDQLKGNKAVTDKDFFDRRIADIAVAFERNTAVNDRKANFLQYAGYALLVGILLHATFFVIRLF